MEDTVNTASDKGAPRRFLFDQTFDTDRQRKRKAKEEKPPEPTFSKEELEAARQSGFEEGRTAGLQEAGAALEAATAELVDAIGKQLPSISEEQAAANDRLMHDGARVATTIARKILPAHSVNYGTSEIEALVTQCLRSLVDQSKIVVRVHPGQVEPITQHLETAVTSSGFDGRFLVEPDDNMGPSDCRLAWPGGGLERQESDIWDHINAAIDAYLGDAMPDGTIATDGLSETSEPTMEAAAETADQTAEDAQLEPSGPADVATAGQPEDIGTTPAPETASVDARAEAPNATAGDAPAGDTADAPAPLEDR